MVPGCLDFRTTCQLSRRRLLEAGTAGIAGLSLPALLKAEQRLGSSPRAKHIIFLHQFGGPSHLDTFDMKPTAPAGIRGEFQPIATGQPGLIRQRTLAPVRHGDRPVRPGPIGQSPDEEPQLRHVLQPDRACSAAR